MFLQKTCSQLHLVKNRKPSQSSLIKTTKDPSGKFDLMEKKPTVRRYFNQRFLNAVGRLCIDVEYLLTAQCAVESKQVVNDASIMLRQSKGMLYRGRALTTGLIQN